MNLKKIWIICMTLLIMTFAGCKSLKQVEKYERRTDFEKLSIAEKSGYLNAFTVSEQGEVFLFGLEGELRQCDSNGSVKKSFQDEELVDTEAMACVGDNLYLYQGNRGRLLCLEPENSKFTVILENLETGSAANLVSAGEKLYLLAAGDVQYHHEIYEIDCEKKTITSLEIGDVSAIYGAADTTLYYCQTIASKDACIYRWNSETKIGEIVYDFMGRLETDPLTAFALEQNYLVYCTLGKKGITVCDLSKDKQGVFDEKLMVYPGKNMHCVAGNVFFFSYGESAEECGIGSIYLPEQKLTEDVYKDDSMRPKLSGNLRISTFSPAYYDTSEINAITGIRARLESESSASLTELMAQDDRVDIYLMKMTSATAQELKKQGYYVALNESKSIQSYKEKCFDYIADEMITESGDIWAIPIDITANLMWYVPANFEKYSLNVNDLLNWESFFSLSEQVKDMADIGCVESSGNFGFNLWTQYDILYNDFDNKKVDYRTETFRKYFEKMWSGWNYIDQNPKHPRLNSLSHFEGMIWDMPRYKVEKTLFYLSYLTKDEIKFRKEDGWRVTAAPKLTEESTKTPVSVTCMIINPASKKKELALAYLETIAENPGKMNYINSDLIFKDRSMYGERFDFSQQKIMDIFQVLQNGTLYLQSGIYQAKIIVDYQNERITLDEAIERIQRETDMWLNE